MDTHTIGPWNVRKHSTGDLVIATKATQGDDRQAIALAIINEQVAVTGPERELNAVLMASAPALLAAVEHVIDQVKYCRVNEGKKKEFMIADYVYLNCVTARDTARGVING